VSIRIPSAAPNNGSFGEPRLKHVELGDVMYEIAVNKLAGGMYRANWTCSACAEEGAWAPLSADPAQAVQIAKLGLEVHHSMLHHNGTAVRPTRQNAD
jgi:hypothetical protein